MWTCLVRLDNAVVSTRSLSNKIQSHGHFQHLKHVSKTGSVAVRPFFTINHFHLTVGSKSWRDRAARSRLTYIPIRRGATLFYQFVCNVHFSGSIQKLTDRENARQTAGLRKNDTRSGLPLFICNPCVPVLPFAQFACWPRLRNPVQPYSQARALSRVCLDPHTRMRACLYVETYIEIYLFFSLIFGTRIKGYLACAVRGNFVGYLMTDESNG